MFSAPGTETGTPWLGSYSVDQPIRHLKGARWVGSNSVVRHISHLKEHPGWGSYSIVLCQELEGPSSLSFSCQCWHCGERETLVMAPSPRHESAVLPCFHGCPAFLHRHFPPQSPPSHPLSPSLHSPQQPCPGIAPQSLSSSSQLLCLLGDLRPCPGYIWLQQVLILIPFRLPQIGCFTLSLKCFSSDSDNCPYVGIGLLLQFPHLPMAGPILLTLLCFSLVPSSN